uniref:Secreted protein n=1 Tax=Myripristis murdjan TaxID=586833 RepID=A0A667Y212_9TELE
MSVCLPACLSVCLPVCLPVCLSVCKHTMLTFCLTSFSTHFHTQTHSRVLCVCSDTTSDLQRGNVSRQQDVRSDWPARCAGVTSVKVTAGRISSSHLNGSKC